MVRVADLPAKLAMVLGELSLSRVELAHRLGVDKSLVGRWLAGSVHPTEHNLARLCAVVAERLPAFALADWHLDSAELAQRHGMRLAKRPEAGGDPLAAFLRASQGEPATRGSAYEGFWRTSRPSLLKVGDLFHDYGLIRRNSRDVIEVRMSGSGLDFSGWLIPSGGNVFVFLYDPIGRSPVTVLCKGVSLPRALVLDGLVMLAALNSDRTPVAMPIVIERVGDLGESEEADIARFRGLAQERPLPLDPIGDERLRARLFRDCGPAAASSGGDAFLNVGGSASLSRGSTGLGLEG